MSYSAPPSDYGMSMTVPRTPDAALIWGYLEPVDGIKEYVYRIDLLCVDPIITIGRSQERGCDIILPTKAISEVHCRLKWDGLRELGSASISDWDSTNHTYIGGQKLSGKERGFQDLMEGDEIHFRDPRTSKMPGEPITYAFLFHYNPAWLEESGRWEVVRPLGRGNFATVYLGMNSYTGTHVAMKHIDSGKIRRDVRAKLRNADWQVEATRVMVNLIVKEVAKQMTARHPHIVSVIGFHRDETKNYLLLEYCPGGTVKDWMDRRALVANRIHWDARVAQMFAYEICTALRACHMDGIVHADLKPDNILLGAHPIFPGDVTPRATGGGNVERFSREDWTGAMLSDFGEAVCSEDRDVSMRPRGTPAYMAPEVAQGQIPTAAADVYSTGVMVCEMLTGWRPEHGDIKKRTTWFGVDSPSELQVKLPQFGLEPTCIDWLVHMLAEDPLQRPNMQSAATHLWLAGEHVARPGLYTISDEPAKNLAERQQILSNLSFAPILEEDAEDPDLHYVHEG